MSNKHTIKIVLFLFIFSHQFVNASEDIQQLKFINKQLQLQIEFHLQQQIFNNLEQEKLKLKQIELQQKVVELADKETKLKEANEKIEKLKEELEKKDDIIEKLQQGNDNLAKMILEFKLKK